GSQQPPPPPSKSSEASLALRRGSRRPHPRDRDPGRSPPPPPRAGSGGARRCPTGRGYHSDSGAVHSEVAAPKPTFAQAITATGGDSSSKDGRFPDRRSALSWDVQLNDRP